MKRSTWLALRMLAGVLFVVALIAGALLLSLDRSSDAGDTASSNRTVNTEQADRIARNSDVLDRLLRCLTTARRLQDCIDRVAGPKGPGGGLGRAGAVGQRGARGGVGLRGLRGLRGLAGRDGARGDTGPAGAVGETGAVGPVGEKGERGEPGTDGRDGAPGVDGVDGMDGVDGIDGLPGAQGGPAPQIPCAAQDPALGYACRPAEVPVPPVVP